MTEPLIAYTPTTERGTGVMVPLSKAMSHIMTVFTATARKWPLTNEEAAAELAEAQPHMEDITSPTELLSSTAIKAFTEWKTLTQKALDELNTLAKANPEKVLLGTKPLQDLVTFSWAFLAVMDKELTGVQSDPGKLP